MLPDGRAILPGGFGKFSQRTPLNIGAFPSFETRLVTRFGPDGAALGPPASFAHVTDANLETPEAHVGNVEWDQRFGRRFLLKVDYLRRHGSHEHILDPDPVRAERSVSRAPERHATGSLKRPCDTSAASGATSRSLTSTRTGPQI